MKKFIIAALLMLSLSANAQSVKREGNTFKVEQISRNKAEPIKTKFTWEYKGIKYPIFISKSGSCFILKMSKAGKEYRQYLPKEVSIQIAKEYNIKYTPKTK